MRTIGGLAALRKVGLQDSCIITGEFGGALKPAIVKVKTKDGREMSLSGMVRDGIKSGRRDHEGREVLSIIRKDVTVAIRTNKDGVTFMDSSVKGSGDGWMSADDILRAKEVERAKADEVVAKTSITETRSRHIGERSRSIAEMWGGIRSVRTQARNLSVNRAKRAS